MKCKLCANAGITVCSVQREWSEPKPRFAWGEKETIATCWLCPDHNWRAADLALAIRRSLLDFRIKVNKGLDSFPASLSVSIATILEPDDAGEVVIHRVPNGEHVEVNHMGVTV